jgi:outer membrane immunogenic protein
MKKIIAIASLCGLASTVSAQSAFEGAFGQIGIGYESVQPKVAGEVAQFISIANSSSLAGNVSAGYYFGVTKSFLLGVGADYSPLPSQKANVTVSADGTVVSDAQKTNSYNIFVSPAIAIDKDKLAYAKLGYTGAAVKIVDTPDTGGATNTLNYTGFSFGLGYKQMFTSGLYGFAEGNYAMYGKKNVPGGGNGTIEASSMNFLVGVGYKF